MATSGIRQIRPQVRRDEIQSSRPALFYISPNAFTAAGFYP
jgi:hypothetical protein